MNTDITITLIAVVAVILLILILTLIIIGKKHFSCWPFKYGGFKEDNGYDKLRKR